MIRYSLDKPPVITRSESLGFATFKGKYDLNIIACRNMQERPDTFQDTIHVVYHDGSKWIEYVFPCTTHAGQYYLNNPSRNAGTAILKHDHQYRSSFKIGMRSSGYECLVPCKDIAVWRDGDCDSIVEYGGEDHDSAGIQIHRANATDTTVLIGRYSAGCVVLQSGFTMFMDLCKKQVQNRKGSTYSLTILKGMYL
jgi:hypothetical protein